MFLAAVLLLAAAGFGDDPIETLLKSLRSEDPAVRSRASEDLLAAWPTWSDADLSKLDDAALDLDPEINARAVETRARIRIRRTLGQNLVHRIERIDDAFLREDDAAKLTVLREAKTIWNAGNLTKEDLAGLELLATKARWTNPAALDRFLAEPDAKLTFGIDGDAESRVRVRTKEVQLLGTEGRKKSGQVAEFLSDGAPEVRTMAVRVMGGLQARDQAPKVAALLKDSHPGVKVEALALLSTWGAKEYAADFARLLDDSNGSVRWHATETLGIWGQRDAGPRIAKLLKDPFAPSRAEAAAALGSFGAREFAADLAPLLADPQAMVRRNAAYALGRFGAAEFATRIKKLLDDRDPEVRWTAAQSLGQLGSDVQAVELVGLLRDADPEVRAEAAWVLGFTASRETVQRLELLLQDPDAEVRCRAVWSLGLRRAPEFRPAVAALLNDPAAWVRSEAVAALGRIGGKDDAPALAAKLRDPDRKTRIHAALALGDLGAGDPEGVLAGLERDEDRLLALSSTLSLARLGKVRAAALRVALREIATDSLAFACLGAAASEAASFIYSREAWAMLDRPLPLRRSVETWTDLSSALFDTGLVLETRTDCTIGRLDKSRVLPGRDALAWLLGRFSTPVMVLDGRKVRLLDRRDSLDYWLKWLEGK